jgi:ATP-dependent helicase/nuclease subunit A
MKSGSDNRTDRESLFQFDQNICLCAGAGSGKTSALVKMYCALISGESSFKAPVALERIVAITFTEKAAAEMKKRVRETIELRLKDAEDQAFWKEHLRKLEWAPIKTIHSFCAGIVREYPVETGVDPAFTVLDEYETAEQLERIVHEVVMKGLFEKDPVVNGLVYSYGFSRSQYVDGLKEFLQRLCRQVYASGLGWKQINQMSEENHKKAEECLSTAVHDLQEDCKTLGDILLAGEIKQSLKSYATLETLVQHFRTVTDRWSGFSPLEKGGALIALRPFIKGRWPNVVSALKKNLEKHLGELEEAYYQLLSRNQLDGLQHLLEQVTSRYENWKVQHGVLDFDDLQIKTRNVLRYNRSIRRKLKDRYTVIMIDEFQDTNQVQKEIVYYLSEDSRSESCVSDNSVIRLHPRKLYVVGDPKQSIYCFRGADVTVFLEMQSELEREGIDGRNFSLRENFRSHKGLIAFFNLFFNAIMRDGKEHYEINFKDDDYQEYQREIGDTGPCVELITMGEEEGSELQRKREAVAVSKRILEVVQPESSIAVYERDERGGERRKKHPEYTDIAILFRRFTHIKLYERELRRREIPYYVVKGRGFFACQEIKDILNFLKYLDGESDAVALVGVLRSPLVGISDETLYWLLRGIGKDDRPVTVRMLEEQLSRVSSELTQEDRGGVTFFLDLLCQLKNDKDRLTPAELIERIMENTHYEAVMLTTFQGQQKVANVRKLIELARRFSRKETGLLRDFTAYLNNLVEGDLLEPEAQTTLENANVVRLMTIHQAKGLEFPIVFLPDLGHSIHQPVGRIVFDELKGLAAKFYRESEESYETTMMHREIRDLQQKKDHAESKRLFYVAATRARDYLVLSGEKPARKRAECWREWLDQFLEHNQELVRIVQDDTIGERSFAQGKCFFENDEGYKRLEMVKVTDAKESEALTGSIIKQSCLHPDCSPDELSLSVTELSEYMVCPQRFYYRYGMGLEEGIVDTDSARDEPRLWHEPKGKGVLSGLDKGNAVHFVLKHIRLQGDLEQKREAIDSLLLRQGLPSAGNEIEELKENILSFFQNDVGRALANNGKRAVLRELPFVMRLKNQQDSFTVLIQGAVDLIYQDTQGIWNIVDYKYSAGKEIDRERYKLQLMIYALAVMKQVKTDRVQLVINVLEDGDVPLTQWHVTREELENFADQIVVCAQEIAQRQTGGIPGGKTSPAESSCRHQDCIFRTRCFN